MEYAFIPQKALFARLAAKREQSAILANLPQQTLRGHFDEWMFITSLSMTQSVGYDKKSVRLTWDAIPTIFDKLGHDANPKQISNLMEKLNRKQLCMSDNRVILGPNYWTFTCSRIRE